MTASTKKSTKKFKDGARTGGKLILLVGIILILSAIIVALSNPEKVMSYPVGHECCVDLCASKGLSCYSFNNEYFKCIEPEATCTDGYSMVYDFYIHNGKTACESIPPANMSYVNLESDTLQKCKEVADGSG